MLSAWQYLKNIFQTLVFSVAAVVVYLMLVFGGLLAILVMFPLVAAIEIYEAAKSVKGKNVLNACLKAKKKFKL